LDDTKRIERGNGTMNLVIRENKIAKMTIEISKTIRCPMDEKMEKYKMWYTLVTLQTCID
jgi:hypothetical protein